MVEAVIDALRVSSLSAGLPRCCLHSPPCDLGKDVTSLSNNLHDDNQCRHNTTEIKSICQHVLDNCFMPPGPSQNVP